MKKQDEKRSLKTLRIPDDTVMEIEKEAKSRGMNFSAVAVERLQHHGNELTPEMLARLQDIANHATDAVRLLSPTLAMAVQMEVEQLWKFLK